LVTIIAYQFVLLNDGIYLDGWYLDGWQRRKEWDIFKRLTNEVGIPYLYYLKKLNGFHAIRKIFQGFLALLKFAFSRN